MYKPHLNSSLVTLNNAHEKDTFTMYFNRELIYWCDTLKKKGSLQLTPVGAHYCRTVAHPICLIWKPDTQRFVASAD